jgi:hypothetical protein
MSAPAGDSLPDAISASPKFSAGPGLIPWQSVVAAGPETYMFKDLRAPVTLIYMRDDG